MSNKKNQALSKLEELQQLQALKDAMEQNALLQNIKQSQILNKAKLPLNVLRSMTYSSGKDKVESIGGAGAYDLALGIGGVGGLLNFPNAGKIAAENALEAQKRKAAASNGINNNYDKLSAASHSFQNIGQLGKNSFYTAAALAAMGSTKAAAATSMLHPAMAIGPGSLGTLAGKATGGMDLLGGKVLGGLSGGTKMLGLDGTSAALAGINPMIAGMATMMALSKGGSALHKMFKDNSAMNAGRRSNRQVDFHARPAHELEEMYGNATSYMAMINRMQAMNQISADTAILGNILATIEGHTSVLPLMASHIDNASNSKLGKSNKALNHLSTMFGDDGVLHRRDQKREDDPGITFKLLNGLERFTSDMQMSFDLMGQFSNTLNGKSSTRLHNEAMDVGKQDDQLKGQKDFGRKFGVSTSMVQAIHTTPSQIMDTSDSYEGRVLSILGLISEISRFSAHELLQIRSQGFGISAGTSSSYLQKMIDKAEEDREAKDGSNKFYERWLKNPDEMMGYIPGWNILSGGIKIVNKAIRGTVGFYGDTIHGKKDENGVRDPNNKTRSIGKVWNDWLGDSWSNKDLKSIEGIKNKIGANEKSAEQRMASYLGMDFPNKVEELLNHIKRIDESTAALAGPIKRNNRVVETMNKYTGKMGDAAYHKRIKDDIRDKLEIELDTLDEEQTGTKWLFGKGKKDTFKARQRAAFNKANSSFLSGLDRNETGLGRNNLMSLNKNQVQNHSGGLTIHSSNIQQQQDAYAESEYKQSMLKVQQGQLSSLRAITKLLKECCGEDGKFGRGGSGDDPEEELEYGGFWDSIKDMLPDSWGLGGPDLDKNGKRKTARQKRQEAIRRKKLAARRKAAQDRLRRMKINRFKQNIGNIGTAAIEGISNFGSSIASGAKSAAKTVATVGKSSIEYVIDNAKSAWTAVKSGKWKEALRSTFSLITNFVKSPIPKNPYILGGIAVAALGTAVYVFKDEIMSKLKNVWADTTSFISKTIGIDDPNSSYNKIINGIERMTNLASGDGFKTNAELGTGPVNGGQTQTASTSAVAGMEGVHSSLTGSRFGEEDYKNFKSLQKRDGKTSRLWTYKNPIGLVSPFANALNQLGNMPGNEDLYITSAFRSPADQQRLIDANPKQAAAGLIGSATGSKHTKGLAVDMGGLNDTRNKSKLDALDSNGTLKKLGLWRPLTAKYGSKLGEWWHLEPIGSRSKGSFTNMQGEESISVGSGSDVTKTQQTTDTITSNEISNSGSTVSASGTTSQTPSTSAQPINQTNTNSVTYADYKKASAAALADGKIDSKESALLNQMAKQLSKQSDLEGHIKKAIDVVAKGTTASLAAVKASVETSSDIANSIVDNTAVVMNNAVYKLMELASVERVHVNL